MSDDMKEVYDTAMAGYRAVMIEEEAAFQRATLIGDRAEQVRASQALASYRVAANEYHQMASQQAAAMRPAAPANKYGLSPEEVETARIAFTPPPEIPPHQRNEYMERSYAEKKQLLRDRRASGEYRQTTEQTG